jgi:hypothetical protein
MEKVERAQSPRQNAERKAATDHRPDVDAQAPPKPKKPPTPQSILGNAVHKHFLGSTVDEAKQVAAALAEKHGDFEAAVMVLEATENRAAFFAGVDFKAITGRELPVTAEAAS